MYEPGDVVDGYRIVAHRASGGMGSVYRATHLTSGEDVALKLCTTPQFAAYLERERVALAAIAPNPNVVRYVGDAANFVVEEWLDGEDLRAVLARGPLSVDAVLRIASELCVGLAAVHAAGIVHRDVKPANVMIGSRTVLLDFGLAQPTGSVPASNLGTAAYLAPELIGRRARVDARADIYALGCVLYECLTGVPPFGNDAHTLLRGLLEVPQRIRTRELDVPDWLDALVARMLRKDPDERPRDGAAAAAALAERGSGTREPPLVSEVPVHAFALVRAEGTTREETLDLALAAPDALSAICHDNELRVDSVFEDLVLTAREIDPRDQLRRLLGATLQMLGRLEHTRIAVVTGGRAVREAIARGRALLANAADGCAYADDETRRLAPGDCASFLVTPSGLRIAPPGVANAPPVLVGRDSLVASLRTTAGFAIVFGHPGVGKTAVLHAVRVHGALIEGRLHLATAPYSALRTWIRRWVMHTGVTDEAQLQASLLEAHGRRAGLVAAELAHLVGFSTGGRVGSREALEGAIVEWIVCILDGQPLYIDDAQWLDGASVATLIRLLDHPRHPPIVLVARPELRTKSLELVARATSIEELPPLDLAASVALVHHVTPDLDLDTARAIARDAEGHPLVVIELARQPATEPTPRTVIGLVQSRLLRLSPTARKTLAIAAVHERLRREGSDAVAVDELCAAGILVVDGEDVRFDSALVEEAAYELVPSSERVALHLAIARSLAVDPTAEPAVLHHHAEAAQDADLLVLAHVLAAERAIVLFDFEGAREEVRAGIGAGAAGEQLGRLRRCEAEALLMGERYAEADVRACEAAETLRVGSLAWMQCCAVRTYATHRSLQPALAMELFDELAACTVDEGPATQLWLQLLISIAGNLMLIGLVDDAESRSALVEAMVAERAVPVDLEAALCRLRARRAQCRGQWDRYRDEFLRSEQLLESAGDIGNALLGRLNRAHAIDELGDATTAIDLARSVVAEAIELDLPYALGYGRFLLGSFLRRCNRGDEGIPILMLALEDADEDPRRAGEIAIELALDAVDRDAADAERHAARALDLLARAPTHFAQAHAVRSLAALAAGDTSGALEWADRAHCASLGPIVEDLSIVRIALLEACRAAGDPRGPELARAALAELAARGARIDAAYTALFFARPDHRRLREVATALIVPSTGE